MDSKNYINVTQNKIGYFEFLLKNNRNQTLLSSENYTSKTGCINGANSLKINAQNKSNYVSIKNVSKYFFFIKAGNGQILAKSNKFDDKNLLKIEMEKIQSIFQNEEVIIKD